MNWYETSYRRHLLDMHINDWDDGLFLSQFDPDVYADNLIRANVRSAMIYMQSHVGYCYYPTKTGYIHPAFRKRPYAMKMLAEKLHRAGIDVTAYYSLVYNNMEAIRHPDWRLIGEGEEQWDFSGKRYLHCCPNSRAYRAFTLEQISEILDYTDFDGIFFDMLFWPKLCTCPSCRERYRNETGKELPSATDPAEFRAYARVRDRWINEFAEEIRRHCKSLRPSVTVLFNLSSIALSGERMIGERIPELSDFATGDLYNGVFAHSFACKLFYAVSRAQPFECMTSRCPDLKMHTLSRSRDQLRISLLTVTAHHGANFVIDAVDPLGTMDERFYDELGELYRETGKYEPYMKTGELLADAGLLFSVGHKYDKAYHTRVMNAAKTLTNEHIPYGVLTEGTIDKISRFRTVIVTGCPALSDQTVEALLHFAAEGGSLYLSGTLPEKLLDAAGRKQGTTEGGFVYLAPEEAGKCYLEAFTDRYPAPFACDVPLLETEHEVLARITLPYRKEGTFASIHSDPPGVRTDWPGMIRRKYGKGQIFWSAVPFEGVKSARMRSGFRRLISDLSGGLSLETDAPEQVELVLFREEGRMLMSAVYLTDDETAPKTGTFRLTVRTGFRVTEARDLTDGGTIPFSEEEGRTTLSFDLPGLFRMVGFESRFAQFD